MPKPRELRRRIRSVQSTRKITKTMELVATSKLKRAQDRVIAARPYAAALAAVMADLYAPELAERFPLLRQPAADAVRRVALLLITSNRGLCGAFNANLIRQARHRIEELERQGGTADLHLVGRKGLLYFRFAKRPIASQRTDVGDKPTAAHAAEIVAPLMAAFAAGRVDAVEVVFAQFRSAVSTPPTVLRILPVSPPPTDPATDPGRKPGVPGVPGYPGLAPGVSPRSVNYILKPSAEAILESLLPIYVRNQVYRALVETAAAEHGARRTAMKNATDSAGDMIDVLTRTYNRARQGQITQEIAEIVGGAEALKG
ncbi:MAG: F0F1 ATP synthase subunit gamma [Gemmatimonadetes bacterium]|nr:MAG: F0F1 ATP synthase subunit gamma [Gemmatimonadota bacterium]